MQSGDSNFRDKIGLVVDRMKKIPFFNRTSTPSVKNPPSPMSEVSSFYYDYKYEDDSSHDVPPHYPGQLTDKDRHQKMMTKEYNELEWQIEKLAMATKMCDEILTEMDKFTSIIGRFHRSCRDSHVNCASPFWEMDFSALQELIDYVTSVTAEYRFYLFGRNRSDEPFCPTTQFKLSCQDAATLALNFCKIQEYNGLYACGWKEHHEIKDRLRCTHDDQFFKDQNRARKKDRVGCRRDNVDKIGNFMPCKYFPDECDKSSTFNIYNFGAQMPTKIFLLLKTAVNEFNMIYFTSAVELVDSIIRCGQNLIGKTVKEKLTWAQSVGSYCHDWQNMHVASHVLNTLIPSREAL